MTAAVEETGLGQAAGKAATLVRDSVKTVIAASMVGTAIEFYDFYAYGTAAANYFPHIFFSAKDNPTVALLMSLLTFAVAFIARPLGSLIFGHFGDRMGRKTTLVVSLMTMGVGTFLIGIGLGGEWSGAALVATENAPEDKRALYGSFPELGAPIGFFLSNGTYFVLESFNNQDAMLAWGWRVPFLLSAILVIVGLVVRVHMEETPIFRMAQEQKKVVKSPLTEVFRKSWRQVLQATFLVAVTYTLFLLDGGLVGQKNFFANMVFLCVGFALMGIAFGPIGAFLPELFDANVRYSGSGIGYNLAAIVGAAFVPTIATWLSSHWGVHSVGLYLAVMAVCCLVSVLTCKETKDVDFTK